MLPRQEPLGLLLASVRRRQRQAVETRVRELKLSSQQFWLLVALRERQGASLADILAALPMDQPTASRVVAAVCRRRLVRIQNDPKDRRRRLMTLTVRGQEIATRCLSVAAQVRGAIVAGFSANEITTFGNWLQRIVANLDELDRTCPPASPRRRSGG